MPIFSRSRNFSRAPRRYSRAARSGSWFTNTVVDTTAVLPTDGDPNAIDLSSPAETVLGNEFNGVTHVRTTGEIQLVVTATAGAPTFTRAFVGVGLIWAPADFITTDTAVASNPNPFDDAYQWIWRRFRNINFAAPATVAGAGTNLYNSYIPMVVRRRVRQPSSKHSLWLVGALNSAGQANIGSLNMSFIALTGYHIP